jgi:Fe-S-cluster containining protein
MEVLGKPVTLEIDVPEGTTTPRRMLPVFQEFSNCVVGRAVEAVEENGELVSCCKGCGACCRQLVPVTQTEALHLAALVEAMPEEKQAEVRARFAAAITKLAEAGIEPGFDHALPLEAARELGNLYFAQGVLCPFLEEESCSIHPDRPLACREYLVTSPAANCANPGPGRIRMVPMAGPLWTSLSRLDGVRGSHVGWEPLVFALHYAEATPEPEREASGMDLFREFVTHFHTNPAPRSK